MRGRTAGFCPALFNFAPVLSACLQITPAINASNMSPKLKKALQLFFFIGLGVGILTLLFRSQNAAFHEQCRLDGTPEADCSLVDKLWQDFSSVHLGWMLLVAVAFTVSNIFRARRWQMQLAPLDHRVSFANSLLTILLGYFVNLGFPRMGEVARAGALSRYEKVPLEKVMGTLVIDRLMDVICLALVMGLALLFQGQVLLDFVEQRRGSGGGGGSLLQSSLFLALAGFVVVIAALVLVFWKKLLSNPVFQKVAGLLRGFRDGLRSVFRLESPSLFLLYSAGIWLMFFLQCWFNLKAFPPTAHLGAGAAVMVFVFGTLGMVIPSPGGMGTFHALAMAGLALYGIAYADRFSYAMIAFFAIQIFYNIAAGLLSLALLPTINRKKAP